MVIAPPLIEPSSFDLIVLGTGLPQCIVSAAAASAGHSVLHLDPCDFYGSHWSSLPLQEFSNWASSAGLLPFPSQPIHEPSPFRDDSTDPSGVQLSSNGFHVHSLPDGFAPPPSTSPQAQALLSEQLQDDGSLGNGSLENGIGSLAIQANQGRADEPEDPRLRSETEMAEMGLEAVIVEPDRSMYSDFQYCQPAEASLGPSRSYNIDLAGPKLAFCGGQLVDLLLRSGASNYLEFKGLEASYIWTPQRLSPVPSSRADVFKDRSLSPLEKRYLMRFFKLVVDHATSGESELSAGDLDAPFVELLRRQQLPSSIQAIILYAIALANHDQEQHSEGSMTTISSRDGLQSLALYLTSVGRFPNANGAFLYPLYGQGELSQAFSRCAAVKGALYVLRMPVDALLRDKESQDFKGIRTASGQLLFSQKLVTGPCLFTTLRNRFTMEIPVGRFQSRESESSDHAEGGTSTSAGHDIMGLKIAHSICITESSLQPGQSTVMVIFPPQSVTERATGVIRALQLGSNASVCPEGKFLVQLSTVCSDVLVGIEALQEATRSLFLCQDLSSSDDPVDSAPNRHETVGVGGKPTLLWSIFYVQHGSCPRDLEMWILPGHVAVCGMPDETLDYRSLVTSAEKVFEGLFPGEEFFPRAVHSDNDIEGVELDGPMDSTQYSMDSTERS